MAEQYAGITLGVDVSQVNNASKSLQQFKRANEDAAKGMQDFTNQEYIARQRAKDLAESLSSQRKEMDNVRSAIDPTTAKMRKLAQAAESLDKLWSAGAVPDESFFELSSMLETQTNRLNASRKALTEEGRAAIEEAKAKRQAQQAGEKFLADLEAQAAALGKSATELQQMKAAQLGVSAAAEPLINQIQQQNAALEQSAAAARAAAQAQKEEAAAARRAEQAKTSFISQLEQEVNALGKTRTELLEMKAAQLGVSEQAAPLIGQLRGQANQMRLAGITAGQYSQAMRMLPAQITDVVTSLASGMPVWLVAIQQGGQIKDSFGGIGNTFRVLLSYLTPTRLAIGGMASVMALLAKSAYDSYSAQRDLNNALIESGNYANMTQQQFANMTASIAENSKATISVVSSIGTELVRSGKYTADQIKVITTATANWSAVTGQSTDKIIANFDRIAKDPVKALAELNEQYNFLTKGELTRINSLEKVQGKTAAVTAATKIFADTLNSRTKQIADSATPLEKMWDDIKRWATDAWRVVGAVTLGALNLIVDAVSGVVNQMKYTLNQGDLLIGEFVISATQSIQKLPGMSKFGDELVKEQKRVVENAKAQNKDLEKNINETNNRLAKGLDGYIKASQERAKVTAGVGPKEKEAVAKEAEALQKKNKAQKVTVDQGNRILDQYNADIIALRAQLVVLQQHKGVNDQISQQRKTLWNEQAKIQVIEEASATRRLTADEKSILANKEKVLALAEQKAQIGDAILQQERLNKLQDESTKFINKTNAAIATLNNTRAMGDRDAQRAQERAQMEANWKNQGGNTTDPAFQEMMKKQEELYAADDAKRADWLAGAKHAFENYGDAAKNMYDNVGQIASSALDGLSTQMTEFLMTGKASFKDFASSIISMIIKMIMQMTIFNAISGLMGGSTISFAGMSKGFATGGFTGAGGKYEPKGVVHGGEFVFTKEATRRIGVDNLYKMMRGYANGGYVGGGAGGSTVMGGAASNVSFGDINVDINNGNDPRGLEKGVRMIVDEMMRKACGQGGAIYNYINGKS